MNLQKDKLNEEEKIFKIDYLVGLVVQKNEQQ